MIDIPLLTDEERNSLSPHERKVMRLLTTLAGAVQGFPDHERKLFNVVRAWAAIVSFEPHHVKFPAQVEPYMSEEDKKPYMWKEGIIPAEWLVQQIRDSCEWMPAPVVAREMYCAGGFIPVDGRTMDNLPDVGRRPVRPAEREEESAIRNPV